MSARPFAVRALVALGVLLPWAPSPGGGHGVLAQAALRPGALYRPSPVHARLPLERVGPDLLAYNPHRGRPHAVRGSGHTHAAPDHSGISAARQERRLRDLGADHRHDFVWLTAHDVVVEDPGVPGVVHLHGVEVYAARPEGHRVHPHLLALLPDDRFAGDEQPPFGIRAHGPAELVERIHAEDGLAVLAHPSRYAMSLEAVAALPPELWGLEGPSGRTDPRENEEWLDARLSAGRYACVSAGGDIHDEDYKLTRGYQVVGVRHQRPGAVEIRRAVAACDFFACAVDGTDHSLLDPPVVEVRSGALRFHTATEVTLLTAVGPGGRVLASAEDAAELSYRPTPSDRYVRFRAYRARGHALCLSQPIWLLSAR